MDFAEGHGCTLKVFNRYFNENFMKIADQVEMIAYGMYCRHMIVSQVAVA